MRSSFEGVVFWFQKSPRLRRKTGPKGAFSFPEKKRRAFCAILKRASKYTLFRPVLEGQEPSEKRVPEKRGLQDGLREAHFGPGY
jgi:hypothetical protein